ncbi:hypothetical protein XELAEV_18041019mg [Xenopus laevis]|uniref:Uncharacterized protein n=1 Tax=Xenopus laevis TaxID=8355 RepID=A0A974C1E2_XENLA|nr:hypothetical protein XELAEV_18041019mg [Xenopus laevis]
MDLVWLLGGSGLSQCHIESQPSGTLCWTISYRRFRNDIRRLDTNSLSLINSTLKPKETELDEKEKRSEFVVSHEELVALFRLLDPRDLPVTCDSSGGGSAALISGDSSDVTRFTFSTRLSGSLCCCI